MKIKVKIKLGYVSRSVDDLCRKIPMEVPLIDSVHGIARGGLIPKLL